MNDNNNSNSQAEDIILSETALAEALETADKIIRMNYLSELDTMQLIPLSEKEKSIAPASKMRLFHITCLNYDEKENISDKLSGVFNSISGYDTTAVFIISHDGCRTNLYMGTACEDPQRVQISSNTFHNALSGNFPGCISKIVSEENVTELFEDIMTYEENDPVAIASISSAASLRGEGSSYLQGMEKLVDGMSGIPFNLVILASALSDKTISEIKSGYENLYTQLSPFNKMDISLSNSDTDSFSRSIGESLSQTMTTTKGVTSSRAETTGMSRTLTKTKQDEKPAKDKAVDIFAAAASAAGAAAGGILGAKNKKSAYTYSSIGGSIGNAIGKAAQTMIQSPPSSTSDATSESISISISTGTSYSESDAESKTDSTNDTMGDSHTTGKTLQYSMENRSISSLLSAIDVHIKRLTACEGNGAFSCAAYIMAADQSTARMGASLYRSLLTGSSPEASVSYVNVWQERKDTAILCEYLKHMKHPRFAVDNEYLGELTAAITVSSMEMPLHFSLPRKPLLGLSVTSHAEFSRDIIKTEEDSRCINIGNIMHMGNVNNTRVSLSMSELRKHVFISGQPGSGKSNFCYVLLNELTKKGVKFLVIEPAKGEYSAVFGGRDDVNVYGTNRKYTPVLSINPFAFPDDIDVLEHMDRMIGVFNASWPMYAAMPELLKDALSQVYISCGWNLEDSTCSHNPPVFPTFADLVKILPDVIKESSYSEEVKNNYIGSLVTRVKSMTNGICGQIFCKKETDNKKLFDENTIVDISRIGSSETKALIIGILIIRLQEHRFCNRTGINEKLRHVTLLEEAHHLLRETSGVQSMESANLQGMSVELLTNAIAEMRTNGEGFIIADQTPSIMSGAVISNTASKIIFRLPNIRDRIPVGEAIALNESQINEIARLDTGVAVVHQGGWLNPVLCKVDLFPEQNFRPLNYSPDNVSAEKLSKARGTFFELLLSKRIRTGQPSDEICIQAADILRKSDKANDGRMCAIINGYLDTGKIDEWENFDDMCCLIKDVVDTANLFVPFPDNPEEWNDKATKYIKEYADTNEKVIDNIINALIISQRPINPKAISFYFDLLRLRQANENDI